jgi:hypothetical protein
MGRTCSGCGSGAQQTVPVFRGVPLCGVRAGGDSLDTLLGFETTGPRRFFALCLGEPEAVIALSGVAPGVSGVVVVAPLGGGVWCLICG